MGWHEVLRGWVSATAAVGVLVAGLGVVGAPPPASGQVVPGQHEIDRAPNVLPTLDRSLHDDLETGAPVYPWTAMSTGELLPPPGTPVTVVVEGDPAAATAAVLAAGGTVTLELDDRVQADVPVPSLDEIATAPGVTFVREPIPIRPAVTSQGVATTGASAWQNAGWVGTGVKVAILDVGFAGYSSRLGPTGELGGLVTTDFSRCSAPEGQAHGTAVAEIVHDVAPGSALHLVCIDTAEGFISALQSMAAQGVRVVNGSIGIVGAGRGDGSGAEGSTVAGAVRALRRQGILYVASAGNYGETHWHGNAVGDSGPDGTDFVNLTSNDSLGFVVMSNSSSMVTIQWDEWTDPGTDFDLYVYNPNCGGWIAASERDQASGASPVEVAVFSGCPGTFSEIYVNRYSGSGTPRLDVYIDGEACCIEGETASSLAEPASSEATLSVGAACHRDGSIRAYSSRGPTIDGRVEPDIAGPDGVDNSVYGTAFPLCLWAAGSPPPPGVLGFLGTSASAPHVAGAAALIAGANPDLDVAELQQLVVSRAVDAGPAGRDNRYGAGNLAMGPAGSAATPTPLAFTPMVPVRLYDTRPVHVGAAEVPARATPVGPGQTLTVPVRGVAGVPADAVAVALNVTVVAPTANGHLTVQPETGTPTTSNLNFRVGQTIAQQVTATVGSANSVRVFNAAGNSHVVVDVTGWYGPNAAPGVPATELFNALPAPVRALDTRQGQGYAEPTNRTTRLESGTEVVVDLDLPGGIPIGASAAIVNLTVTQGTTSGHLTAFPADASAPTASNINFAAGQIIANLAVVPLAADGSLRLRAMGTTHVVVDVVGWFEAGAGAGYIPLNPPMRVLDTRTGNGLRLGPITMASPHDQLIGRFTGVPADAEAVAMGVVAVAPSANSFLTVFPTGQPVPTSSTLNFPTGHTISNAVVAALGDDGRVRFAVAAGSVHVVADVSGYFLDPADVPIPLATPP